MARCSKSCSILGSNGCGSGWDVGCSDSAEPYATTEPGQERRGGQRDTGNLVGVAAGGRKRAALTGNGSALCCDR